MKLIGREREQARIEVAVGDARQGTSTSIVLVGEPGIGKSSLLAFGRSLDPGIGVLAAHGVESEREIPFGGLIELLAPLAPLVTELPPAQRQALSVALALESGPAPDRFAVSASVLGLLSRAAEEQSGLVVTIDDAQWLDEPSLEAILFALRRLDRDGIAALIALRPGAGVHVDGDRFEVIELDSLGPDEARELLVRSVDAPLGPEARDGLLELSGGNPLALVEAHRALTPQQIAGSAAMPRSIRPSAAIERAFRTRIAALGEGPGAALVVAAAAQELDWATLERALELRGLVPADLAAAERAGVIRIENGIAGFAHPLLLAVAYHGASATDRREAHRAIAQALAPGEVGRRAWHLAEAASGKDEEAAAALADAAAVARERGALASAGALGERAAQMTDDERRAAGLVLQATEDLIRAGHAESAGRLLGSLSGMSADPLFTAEAKRMRGLLMIRSGRLTLGHDLLIEAADLISTHDPATAARALLEATIRDRIVCDYSGHRQLAARARELAMAVDPPDLHAATLADLQGALVGVSLGEGDAAVRVIEGGEGVVLGPEARLAVELYVGPVHAAVWAEHYEWADRVLVRMIDEARSSATPTEMTYPLSVAAQLELRRARFDLARAHADEGVRLALDTGQPVMAAVALGALADIDASLGDRDACLRHLARVDELVGSAGVDPGRLRDRSIGLLELVRGDPEAAIGPLEHCEASDLAHGTREPRVLQWAANLIEARVWIGAEEAARGTLGWLEEAERTTGGYWTRGAAARARGLLGADEDADLHFGASAEEFGRGQAPFERARTELMWGERLRRARRRADSRAPLRRALACFERVGCRPLAERARRELEATGESVAPATPERRDELTPQELRIGLRVAEGRTNPEVASELFISRKTVERHLSQIYRKLGIRSRTELARVLWPPTSSE